MVISMRIKILRKNTVTILVAVMIIFVLIFICISNFYIIINGRKAIKSSNDLTDIPLDYILILGAGVWDGNRPSPMLADRLDEGIKLYNKGIAPKILVSGDHGKADYDEVNVMKKYLMDAGIPDEDIFMDHAGFSTYESMYRAKEIFNVKKLIIVTQEYHLYRAIYIAQQMGLDTYGSPSDPRTYSGSFVREIREWFARDKDIFTCLLKVKPKYLGETIDIHGSGLATNDRK